MSDSRTTQNSTPQALHYSLLSAFLKGTAKTPQMPENALRIRSLLRDPDASLAHISRVINSDPPLAAYLMQFADSPLLRSARPCRSLRDVLARLGTDKLSNLVLSFSVRNLFISKELPLQKMFRARWNASLVRAAWSACLSSSVPGLNADEALLGGLFQDIGSLPLLAELENWPQISRQPEDLNMLCEQLSAQIGTVLLTVWKQPSHLVDCARYRCSSAQPLSEPSSQLYQVVQIAEAMQQADRQQALAQLPLAQQLFVDLEPEIIEKNHKQQVNLWLVLLGVKTRML
jgi:HD-like signal output (HDOD) protein